MTALNLCVFLCVFQFHAGMELDAPSSADAIPICPEVDYDVKRVDSFRSGWTNARLHGFSNYYSNKISPRTQQNATTQNGYRKGEDNTELLLLADLASPHVCNADHWIERFSKAKTIRCIGDSSRCSTTTTAARSR